MSASNDDFKNLWKWTILASIDQVSSGQFHIAHEIILSTLTAFKRIYHSDGVKYNTPPDDIALLAVLVNSSLIYLGIGDSNKAQDCINILSNPLRHDAIDKIKTGYLSGLRNIITNGSTKSDVTQFATIVAKEYRQLYSIVFKE